MLPLLGDAMAVGCAVAWATAVLLFRGLHAVEPAALNLFKNVVALGLLTLTMLGLGTPFDLGRPPLEWLALAGSGVLGLAVADTLYLAGLRRVDASVAGIAECVYAPSVLLLAALALGEPLTPLLVFGATVVVTGLLVVAWEPTTSAPDRAGLAFCVFGVLTTAVAVVLAKPVLGKSDLVEATTVRLFAGVVALAAAQLLTGRGRRALALFRPQPAWRLAVPGTLLGTYVAMILWLGGMKYGTASRAALLNQSGAVFVLLFSRLAGERISARRAAGAAIALSGVMLVLLGRD